MIQGKWIEALKLVRVKQENSLVPCYLTKEVLLFIVMNRRNISWQTNQKEIRRQCPPVHSLLYFCKPAPFKAKEVFYYIFPHRVIQHLLQVYSSVWGFKVGNPCKKFFKFHVVPLSWWNKVGPIFGSFVITVHELVSSGRVDWKRPLTKVFLEIV